MKVRGLLKEYIDVEISVKDAIRVVAKELLGIELESAATGYCLKVSDDSQKEGLYKYRDMSTHGSPDYEYDLITDNKDDVELYKCIEKIRKYYEKQSH